MSTSYLQRKFLKGEKRINLVVESLDASVLVNQIKSHAKKEDLPPSLPLEEIISKHALLVSEISNLLNRKFDYNLIDDAEILCQSPMSVDFIFGALKIVGNLDSHSIFKSTNCRLLIDCSVKDFLLKLSFELVDNVPNRNIKVFVSTLYPKINSLLSPYGGNCAFQETNDLINNKKHLSLLLTLNRLELFSTAETYEVTAETISGVQDNVL